MAVRDLCIDPSAGQCWCYWDPGHGGISRMVFGDLDRAERIRIEGCYGRQELEDDGGPKSAEGRPWHVWLETVDSPKGERGENRWFFGNFSLKKARERHDDFYVRYVSQSTNKVLEFYKKLPSSVSSCKPVNTWSRVLPGTYVTWACAQKL